jgi:hypothetical protein
MRSRSWMLLVFGSLVRSQLDLHMSSGRGRNTKHSADAMAWCSAGLVPRYSFIRALLTSEPGRQQHSWPWTNYLEHYIDRKSLKCSSPVLDLPNTRQRPPSGRRSVLSFISRSLNIESGFCHSSYYSVRATSFLCFGSLFCTPLCLYAGLIV